MVGVSVLLCKEAAKVQIQSQDLWADVFLITLLFHVVAILFQAFFHHSTYTLFKSFAYISLQVYSILMSVKAWYNIFNLFLIFEIQVTRIVFEITELNYGIVEIKHMFM